MLIRYSDILILAAVYVATLVNWLTEKDHDKKVKRKDYFYFASIFILPYAFVKLFVTCDELYIGLSAFTLLLSILTNLLSAYHLGDESEQLSNDHLNYSSEYFRKRNRPFIYPEIKRKPSYRKTVSTFERFIYLFLGGLLVLFILSKGHIDVNIKMLYTAFYLLIIAIMSYSYKSKISAENAVLLTSLRQYFKDKNEIKVFEENSPLNLMFARIEDIFYKIDLPICLSFILFGGMYFIFPLLKPMDYSGFAYGGLSLHVLIGTFIFLIEHSERFFSINIKQKIEDTLHKII